jgi:hypothetical protein
MERLAIERNTRLRSYRWLLFLVSDVEEAVEALWCLLKQLLRVIPVEITSQS